MADAEDGREGAEVEGIQGDGAQGQDVEPGGGRKGRGGRKPRTKWEIRAAEGIGERLKAAREGAGIKTLRRAADAARARDMDVTADTLGSWERGASTPTCAQVEQLSMVYGEKTIARARAWEAETPAEMPHIYTAGEILGIQEADEFWLLWAYRKIKARDAEEAARVLAHLESVAQLYIQIDHMEIEAKFNAQWLKGKYGETMPCPMDEDGEGDTPPSLP